MNLRNLRHRRFVNYRLLQDVCQVRGKTRGFALISVMAIMSLVTMIALAMLSLSTVTSKTEVAKSHMDIARANARMALSEALSQLQLSLGRDQSVCANASIFERHDDPFAKSLGEGRAFTIGHRSQLTLHHRRGLLAGQEVAHVAVLHDVVLTLAAHTPRVSDRLLRVQFLEVGH